MMQIQLQVLGLTTAFNCGDVPTQFTNYDITFAGVRPDAGTLNVYPVGGNKYYNLSLFP